MSHSKFMQGTPGQSCWNCYWQNGEKIGDHLVCHQNWPRKKVVSLPDAGCAVWTAVPSAGEPLPLTSDEQDARRGPLVTTLEPRKP